MASAVTELLSYITSIIGPAAGDPRTAASVRTPLGQLASRTQWLRRFQQLLFGSELVVSAADTGTDVLTVTAHGLPANTAVQIYATDAGVLPGGLSVGTVYYVDVVTGDTIKLSATSGPGAAVDLTAGFAGPVFLAAIPDWSGNLLLSTTSYGSGKLVDLAVFLAGTQTIIGAKTFSDITASGTTKYKLAARSKSKSIKGTWLNSSDSDAAKALPFDYAVGGVYRVTLDVPNGATLTGASIRLNPEMFEQLPTNLPTIAISKVLMSDGTSSTLGTQADTSADGAAYGATHSITLSGLSEVVDNDLYTYRLVHVSESGIDSDAGIVLGASVSFTTSAMDDAAA